MSIELKEDTMHEYLKIKVKHLAAEARIIRHEELRVKRRRDRDEKLLEGLHYHRVTVVRSASRCTHLAYGFLRNVPYRAMENAKRTRSKPAWGVVEKMVKKYGQGDQRDLMQKFSEWKDAA